MEDKNKQDEQHGRKPWVTVFVFLGMFALAGVICAALWHFTHLDGNNPGEQEALTGNAASEEGTADLPEGSDGERAPEAALKPTAEPTAEPSPEPTAEPTAEPTSEPSAEIAPGTGTETGQESAQDPISGDVNMVFAPVQESVTPKDVINLRSTPSTVDSDNIVRQARNGETLTRIGINTDTGWSKIDSGGTTLYAVSQYLTTDLSYKQPVQTSDTDRVNTLDGRVILFTDCDDWISPKEYVNLRTEPSTSEGNATVSCQLYYGEKAHRTGYSPDSGWSRVEYNGQVLYVVTSYVYQVSGE